MAAPEWARPDDLEPMKVADVFSAEGHDAEFATYPDVDTDEGATVCRAAVRCSCGFSRIVTGGDDVGTLALEAIEQHYEAEVEALASPIKKEDRDDG